MTYLVIKNHDAMYTALADLKSAKGVKVYKVEEIEVTVRQSAVPCMKED